MTSVPPDRSNDAIWKQRYRRPELSGLQVARGDRERAIVLNDTTGVKQAYALDLRSGAMTQLTHAPAGSIFAALSRDGRHLFVLDDVDGNEVGHWTRRPLDGGPEIDLTRARLRTRHGRSGRAPTARRSRWR